MMMRETDTTREPSKERRGWHLDKSVNLPFLLALAVASMGAFSYIMSQNARQAITETKIMQQEMEIKTVKSDLKEDIKQINNKLDLILMERRK